MVKATTGSDISADLSLLDQFPDANTISNYAKESIAWAVENGLISGNKGNIDPKGNANRGQCTKMILATLDCIQ